MLPPLWLDAGLLIRVGTVEPLHNLGIETERDIDVKLICAYDVFVYKDQGVVHATHFRPDMVVET